MDSSKDICNYLLSGKAVVLNMEGIHMEVAQRIIDFVSGAAYSMDGNLQRISNYIFIVTPNSVEPVSYTHLDMLFDYDFRNYSFRLLAYMTALSVIGIPVSYTHLDVYKRQPPFSYIVCSCLPAGG